MAQTESENDCEMEKEKPESESSSKAQSDSNRSASSTTSATGVTASKGAGPMNGGGSASRRSRRKQSEPRRVDSDIVKMEVDMVEIKSEVLDHDDNRSEPKDLDDDDVFLSVRTNNNMLSPTVPRVSSGSKHLQAGSTMLDQSQMLIGDRDRVDVLRRTLVNDDDCQPEDLSLSSKIRDHNRVVLAIPSVVRPTNVTKSKDIGHVGRNNDSSPLSSHSLTSQTSSHPPFRTFPHDLQPDGSLVALERDYRLKYRHDYDDAYHDPHSHSRHEYSTPVPIAISHHHQVMLDQGQNSHDLVTPGERKETNGNTSPSTSTDSSSSTSQSSKATGAKVPRSYKNLSRSRRIVANARERNRVHTISAAFEGLRRAVPSYSHNQKLSKLAILRIACSYILALAKLADLDYSHEDEQQMTFEDCVDLCTETLQAEGRSKRRKGPVD